MSYALVTGASSGLGALFAEALAAQRHDLVVVARRGDRLEALAAKLRADHGVVVEVFAFDLSVTGAGQRLADTLKQRGIVIDTLINNAGLGAHGGFATMDPERIDAIVAVNIAALTTLCRALLPDMIAAKRGAILNVASVGSFVPGPWFAVYFATKAYVLSLSEALHQEVRGTGVSVTALCPGPTRTEFGAVAGMADTDGFDWVADDPGDVVRAGLKALAKNRAVKVTGKARPVVPLLGLLPRGLKRRLLGKVQSTRR